MVDNFANDNDPEVPKGGALDAFRAKYPKPSFAALAPSSDIPASLLGNWIPTEEIVEGEDQELQRFYVRILPPYFTLDDQETVAAALSKHINGDDFYFGPVSPEDSRWTVGVRAEAYEAKLQDVLSAAKEGKTSARIL